MGHVGLEPTTYGLKGRYSTIELMTQNRPITTNYHNTRLGQSQEPL
jgi:hypothetical protein